MNKLKKKSGEKLQKVKKNGEKSLWQEKKRWTSLMKQIMSTKNISFFPNCNMHGLENCMRDIRTLKINSMTAYKQNASFKRDWFEGLWLKICLKKSGKPQTWFIFTEAN